MSHAMTATGIETKNAIANAGAWLILVDIDATGIGGNLYRRTSDYNLDIWQTRFYTPVAMSFGDVQESLQGGLPRIDMRVSKLDVDLGPALNLYDGLRGAVVTVYVVPSGNIAANVAELTEVFTVVESSADNQWITLTLGFADPLGRRFPRDSYTAAICRHAFKGAFCRYPGALTTCDHTLRNCQTRNNTPQFGGSPGTDEGVYQ